jgi:5-methylcytosine-specific restriction endonuclease McrA
MTLRRYTPLHASRGTVIPTDVRLDVYRRDRGCVGRRVGMPGPCNGRTELDHVRASGALGRKSRTEPDNLVMLCAVHHRLKTEAGRTWRPALLAYLGTVA